mmetsp:Transcript_1034/g.1776  ORF Transcript_1034/g.1776 Transcript_1034/m.1776 type:complete len:572 (+) Transcript_1034:153-1868(+)|eukprot:CAMPEP_0197515432 /NCGR_PEP_ID=MMETSP1318-20131121/571_1 /TAXON_ID=552666 /ORGANISM="Partenskyella glossopodia, Strain RCC365" /LENGTH=571 /DNA_ID=CAMNT_0043063805 /DNA_START=157 /DNA_END=1872 /DNA_ORIENTATION=-
MTAKRIEPYWLIGFPQEYKGPTPIGMKRLLDNTAGYATVKKFEIPGALKIGTLDSLMALTESMGKIDATIAHALAKVARTYEELGQKSDKLFNELAQEKTGKTPAKSIENFEWNFVKYKISASLQSITNIIEGDAKNHESTIRKHVNELSEISQTLDSIERTENGTLLVKPLGPIIKKAEIHPSPSLEIVFIVVSNKKKEEFLKSYESMEQGYKLRRAKKQKEEMELKAEADRHEVGKIVPDLLARAADEQSRKQMLQGGSIYKHIADIMRKANSTLKSSDSDSKADSFAEEAKKKLKADVQQLSSLLAEAIERKLIPYESQPPNNSASKNAVVDVVLTSDEFKIPSKRVESCRKMVAMELAAVRAKIQKSEKALEREKKKQRISDPPYIVPGSAKILDVDDEYSLFELTILKKFKSEVLKLCREKRLTVRAYKYDALGEKKHKVLKKELKNRKKIIKQKLMLKCRTYYPEIFMGWMHVKAIRVFAESVLRFGLPRNQADMKAIFPNHIQAALIQPVAGHQPRVRKTLGKLYSNLASSEVTAQLGANETDYSGFGSDFYPYVYVTVDPNHA